MPLVFGCCILIIARAWHPDLSEGIFKTRAKDHERRDVTARGHRDFAMNRFY